MDLAKLNDQVEKSYAQVQSIAVKAVEGTTAAKVQQMSSAARQAE